jgi:hypothetical protein
MIGMDPTGPIARRFPLIARPRPACTPLHQRVADLCDRARAAYPTWPVSGATGTPTSTCAPTPWARRPPAAPSNPWSTSPASTSATATALLDDTAPGEPWENAVTACLGGTALCRRHADQLTAHDLATLLDTYQQLDPTPGLAVFHTRLALSAIDATGDIEHPTDATSLPTSSTAPQRPPTATLPATSSPTTPAPTSSPSTSPTTSLSS